MNTHAIASGSVHDEVALLLPWYINGTLDGSQKALVEGHVRNCIACRRELAIEDRTLEAFCTESPLDQSAHVGFQRLHDRITAHSSSRLRRHVFGTGGQLWAQTVNIVHSITSPGLRAALVGAPLAVVAIGFGLTHLPPEQAVEGEVYSITASPSIKEGYQTLSSRVESIALPGDLQVVFAPGTSIEAIDTLLQNTRATIIDGPGRTGLYTIRPRGVSGENEHQALILFLRAQPEVAFAEAAQPVSDSDRRKALPQ